MEAVAPQPAGVAVIHAHVTADGQIDLCGANCPVEPTAPHVVLPVETLDQIIDALSADRANAELRDRLWDLTIQARGKK